MEVIAVASSFAGILGLCGQCLGGLENLKNLFESIAGASTTIDGFLRALNSLLRTLHDVEILLNTIEQQNSPSSEAEADVASLQIQLEDCHRDVSDWLKTARGLRSSSGGRGAKSWIRKFWIAVNQQSVSGIRQEISSRRIEINTYLLLLATTRGIHVGRKADQIGVLLEQGNIASADQTFSSSATVNEVLQRLVNLSNTTMTVLDHSEGSLRSLGSISSSLSRVSNQLDLTCISEEPPPRYSSISRTNSSCVLEGSSRPSTIQSTRRTVSGGSQTSLSISGLSFWSENPEYEQRVSRAAPGTIIRSARTSQLYTCAFCTEQFTDKSEAEQHQISDHRRRYSWSCSALRSMQDAYFQRGDGLICSYCETQVTFSKHSEATQLCRKHLRLAHRFQQCQSEKRFFRLGHFRQHLKSSHNALLGKWNEAIENACMEAIPESRKDRIDALDLSIEAAAIQLEGSWHGLRRTAAEYRFPKRSKSHPFTASSSSSCPNEGFSQYISRMRLAGLLGQEIDFIDHLLRTLPSHDELALDPATRAELLHQRQDLKLLQEDVLYNAEYHRESVIASGNIGKEICIAWRGFLQNRSGEDDSKQLSATEGIKTQAYGASLLGHWNGTRDRVNRWMLHMLGASEEQTDLHRSMLHDPGIPVSNWSRLVLKYWFMDEAASGVELEASHSVGAAESPHASSLLSSDFQSCKSHRSSVGSLAPSEDKLVSTSPGALL